MKKKLTIYAMILAAVIAIAVPALLIAAGGGNCVTCVSFNCIWDAGHSHTRCTTWGGGDACVASGVCEPE